MDMGQCSSMWLDSRPMCHCPLVASADTRPLAHYNIIRSFLHNPNNDASMRILLVHPWALSNLLWYGSLILLVHCDIQWQASKSITNMLPLLSPYSWLWKCQKVTTHHAFAIELESNDFAWQIALLHELSRVFPKCNSRKVVDQKHAQINGHKIVISDFQIISCILAIKLESHRL